MSAAAPYMAPEAVRRGVQLFFGECSGTVDAVGLCLQLLRFNFGWSEFTPCDSRAFGDTVRAEWDLDTDDGQGRFALFLATKGSGTASDEQMRKCRGLAQACSTTMNRPMVREEAFSFFFQQMKACQNLLAPVTLWMTAAQFESVKMCILCAMTDTWSAIRKASANKVAVFVSLLTPSQLRMLYTDLVTAFTPGEQLPLPCSATNVGAWKANEGVLLGVTTLIRTIHQTTNHTPQGAVLPLPGSSGFSTDNVAEQTTEPEQQLTTVQYLDRLLVHIVEDIRPLLYQCLGHAQLSVRENAQKAFIAVLSCSDDTAAVTTFVELINKLMPSTGIVHDSSSPVQCQSRSFSVVKDNLSLGVASIPPDFDNLHRRTHTPDDAQPSTAASLPRSPHQLWAPPLPHTPTPALTHTPLHGLGACGGPQHSHGNPLLSFLSPPSMLNRHLSFDLHSPRPRPSRSASASSGGTPMLGAYEAEGSLMVCLAVVKLVPPGLLLCNWGFYFPVLERYLAHEASTVRQQCSLVFKELLSNHQYQPQFAHLALQSLAMDWTVHAHSLLEQSPNTPSPTKIHPAPASTASPPAEGPQTQDKHPTNQPQAAMPPPMQGLHTVNVGSFLVPQEAEAVPCSQQAAATTSDDSTDDPTGSNFGPDCLSPAWQWREGRLLVYELLLDLLASQHSREACHGEPPMSPIAQLCPLNATAAPVAFSIPCAPPSNMDNNLGACVESTQSPQGQRHSNPPSDRTSLHSCRDSRQVSTNTSSMSSSLSCLRATSAALQTDVSASGASMGITTSGGGLALSTEEQQASLAPLHFPVHPSVRSQFVMLPVLGAGNPGQSLPIPDAPVQAHDAATAATLHAAVQQWSDVAIRWADFGCFLRHALLQVTQCFADARFELRRMADQVLRPLAEVTMWYDLQILSDFWACFLGAIDSLPCWVACSTLLLVLRRSHQLATQPGIQLGTQARALRDQVCSMVPWLAQAVVTVVREAWEDKVCVLGTQLLVWLHAHFGHWLQLDEWTHHLHMKALLAVMEDVFRCAHAHLWAACTTPAADTSIRASPSILDAETAAIHQRSAQHAALVEHSLLTAIHGQLPALVGALRLIHMGRLLPLLVHYLVLYTDPAIQLSLLDTIHHIITKPLHAQPTWVGAGGNPQSQPVTGEVLVSSNKLQDRGGVEDNAGVRDRGGVARQLFGNGLAQQVARGAQPVSRLPVEVDGVVGHHQLCLEQTKLLLFQEGCVSLVVVQKCFQVMRTLCSPCYPASGMVGLLQCLAVWTVKQQLHPQGTLPTQVVALARGLEGYGNLHWWQMLRLAQGHGQRTEASQAAAPTMSVDADTHEVHEVQEDDSDWDDWDDDPLEDNGDTAELLQEVGQLLWSLASDLDMDASPEPAQAPWPVHLCIVPTLSSNVQVVVTIHTVASFTHAMRQLTHVDREVLVHVMYQTAKPGEYQ